MSIELYERIIRLPPHPKLCFLGLYYRGQNHHYTILIYNAISLAPLFYRRPLVFFIMLRLSPNNFKQFQFFIKFGHLIIGNHFDFRVLSFFSLQTYYIKPKQMNSLIFLYYRCCKRGHL